MIINDVQTHENRKKFWDELGMSTFL